MTTVHLSLDIEGDAEDERAVEAHLQDVVPVLRLQHGLQTGRDTETETESESDRDVQHVT